MASGESAPDGIISGRVGSVWAADFAFGLSRMNRVITVLNCCCKALLSLLW